MEVTVDLSGLDEFVEEVEELSLIHISIARNECGISMDDVAMCLNHKSGHDVTDTYIKKDWSRIDIPHSFLAIVAQEWRAA